MEENEVIFIHGAERFSDYQGYARTLAYGGDYVDTKRYRVAGCIALAYVPVALIHDTGRMRVTLTM
jgi:hypothetical protein